MIFDPEGGKKKLLFEIKKKECKNLKITKLDEQETTLQSADGIEVVQVWSWENVFTKTWKLAIASSISENKYWNTGYHAKENPSEEIVSESNQGVTETIKFLNEEVTFSNASAKWFIFKTWTDHCIRNF